MHMSMTGLTHNEYHATIQKTWKPSFNYMNDGTIYYCYNEPVMFTSSTLDKQISCSLRVLHKSQDEEPTFVLAQSG